VVRLGGRAATPHPWINVISNEAFGFHTSAEGASFSWSRNSRDFQLTPWSNDPVTNRPGEAIYIHDRVSGGLFSPFAAVARDPALSYEARHAPGRSTFSVRQGALSVELVQTVDATDPVKVQRLKIVNEGSEPARLSIYAYAEWVLGNNRARNAPSVVPSQDSETGAVLASNPFSLDFSERVAFLAADVRPDSVTTDRQEFLGRQGSVQWPAAPLSGAALTGRVEAGYDPCAALAREVEIAPGESFEGTFLLGDAGSAEEARALVLRHRGRPAAELQADTDEQWRGLLETVQVKTPDAAFDAMVNSWLPYQSLACRIRARSAFYQASGAYGFRDQLQDTLAFLLHDPGLARAQILNAAGRQFREGDVQHWWLPRTGAGVRTMISDDVVWLGYATAHFVSVTGDATILDEAVPFIDGQVLKDGEHDAFFTPATTSEQASIYEHCARGLELAMRRSSDAGLPLILGGDWNDGMNRVGEKGRGESVWLGWFLLDTLRRFAPLAEQRGDRPRAKAFESHARRLAKALETSAWDGEWYRRGSFDDGTPLGSKHSDECRIDSIAQSWSVLAGGERSRSELAMQRAMEQLVDDDAQVLRLFTPPFETTDKDPGYIKSYPPGVRENGGQYTHAATWYVLALAKLGRVDEAWRCFSMLNPINHALDAESAERYRVEPYVVAADVYSGGEKDGRGGWTWYTGSAGWLYRVALEGILGLRREGHVMHVEPAIPSTWSGYTATVHLDGRSRSIVVGRSGSGGLEVTVDGVALDGSSFRIREAPTSGPNVVKLRSGGT
jgi:cyclic beta-1,2-glucan synthetase